MSPSASSGLFMHLLGPHPDHSTSGILKLIRQVELGAKKLPDTAADTVVLFIYERFFQALVIIEFETNVELAVNSCKVVHIQTVWRRRSALNEQMGLDVAEDQSRPGPSLIAFYACLPLSCPETVRLGMILGSVGRNGQD
ncbi:hypothetical protein RRG08_055757 [Elysia crispata]|uniref:Uncharacterized protein n=1 Tax=Elysia crispata TaxID=231223 RepID=A0AAE1DWL6_9GAST|nr:hypothetical protein RRG08_055757 [Elysia crispata]